MNEATYQPLFVASREIRVVPHGWRHPRNAAGRYVPLLPAQMPDVAALQAHETQIVAYETTTEGTPISPAFPNAPEGRIRLVDYCSRICTTFGRHTADAEAWAVILFGEGTAVTLDGVVVAEGA